MRNRKALLASVAILSLLAMTALYLALNSSAGARAGAASAASSGGTGHLVIASNEVIVQDSGCSPITGFSFGITGSSACRHYIAPIHLPDGATITELAAIYDDSSLSADLVILIARSDLAGTVDAGTSFSISSSGTPGKTQTTDSGSHDVDNLGYHYALEVLLPDPNLKFFSAVITYSTAPSTAFGDVDCNGAVDSVDALKTLRHVAALSVSQTEPCPDIGS